MSEGHRKLLEGAPTGQIQYNLTIKMNNGSSLDKTRICEAIMITKKKGGEENTSLQYTDNSDVQGIIVVL